MNKEKSIKILLVDDEQDILDFLKYNLEKEGYFVKTALSGEDGIALAKTFMPNIIILDVMMPEMDGIETCIELRKIPILKNTIITFLSARSEDYSLIAGFNAGADDYISKPIKPRVLISKINSLLRRELREMPEVFNVPGIELNREKYIIIKDGKEIVLPRKEFELLSLLMSKPGKVFTRLEIMDKIWGEETFVGDRTIDVHVRKIRAKLNNELLVTVKGVGYKIELNEPVVN